MIVGLGMDLIEIERIERAAANPRFLERVYTQGERAHIARKGMQTAAGLFAAKEAVAKALGTGFAGFMFQDVEISTDALGKPFVKLHRGALARFHSLHAGAIHITITHSRQTAGAVAVVEADAGGGV